MRTRVGEISVLGILVTLRCVLRLTEMLEDLVVPLGEVETKTRVVDAGDDEHADGKVHRSS
jgi:hypothetical protein